jgi:hypothetical protein
MTSMPNIDYSELNYEVPRGLGTLNDAKHSVSITATCRSSYASAR